VKKVLLTSIILASSVFAEGYVAKANKISKDLLKTLGSNLKKEMKANGPVKTLEFCNLNASKLTKQVNVKYKGIEVKRVSLKPRNSLDKPSKDEAIILKSLEDMYKVGVRPKNIVQQIDGKVKVYKPLLISKKVCLVCHGDLSKNKTLAKKLHKLYPNDKATGYKMHDLRGAIVVTIPKNK
jgi:hypothetical protein